MGKGQSEIERANTESTIGTDPELSRWSNPKRRGCANLLFGQIFRKMKKKSDWAPLLAIIGKRCEWGTKKVSKFNTLDAQIYRFTSEAVHFCPVLLMLMLEPWFYFRAADVDVDFRTIVLFQSC